MQFENPYTPPSTMVSQPTFLPIEQLMPASQGKRFLNFILDYISILVVSFGVGIVYGVLFIVTRQDTQALSGSEERVFDVVGNLLGWIVWLVYYIVMEATCQRSLAKFITGTRVVRKDGGQPTLGQIVGRTFARLIPFEAFSFFGNNGRPIGWHDSLSGTLVVESR